MSLVYRSPSAVKSAMSALFDLSASSPDTLRILQDVRRNARKNDPARHQGLHGPFEEITLIKTGRLPESYYEPGEKEPWGLLPSESRSNILWQVLSGLLDRQPEFGSAYMGLSLDQSLVDSDYRRELSRLHGSLRRYIEKSAEPSHAYHARMAGAYHATSCPACNVLSAMACEDAGLSAIFKSFTGLRPDERAQALRDRGFTPLLGVLIPD